MRIAASRKIDGLMEFLAMLLITILIRKEHTHMRNGGTQQGPSSLVVEQGPY